MLINIIKADVLQFSYFSYAVNLYDFWADTIFAILTQEKKAVIFLHAFETCEIDNLRHKKFTERPQFRS